MGGGWDGHGSTELRYESEQIYVMIVNQYETKHIALLCNAKQMITHHHVSVNCFYFQVIHYDMACFTDMYRIIIQYHTGI